MVRFALALYAQEVQDDGRGGMVLVPPSITPEFHEGDVVQLTRGLPSYVGPVSSGVWRPERGDFQQRRMGLCGTAWWDPTLAAGTGMWLPCSYLVQAVKEDVLGMPGARISALVRGSWWHAGRASEWINYPVHF